MKSFIQKQIDQKRIELATEIKKACIIKFTEPIKQGSLISKAIIELEKQIEHDEESHLLLFDGFGEALEIILDHDLGIENGWTKFNGCITIHIKELM